MGRGFRACVVFWITCVLSVGYAVAQWKGVYEIHWDVGNALRMDSLGRDYSFEGATRTVDGGAVYHAARIEAEGMPAGGIPFLLDAHYVPLGVQVLQRASWVDSGGTYSVRLARGRGSAAVEVEIPAFRLGKMGEIERLSGYRLGWRVERSSFRTRGGEEFAQKQESVLAAGRWVRLSVSSSGMYKLSYSKLKEAGFTDPSRVTLWGLDGRQLSYVNRKDGLDDLLQIPLKWYNRGGADAYAVAYLRGPEWWEWSDAKSHYEYHRHEYENHYNYYITDGRVAIFVEEEDAGVGVTQFHTEGWEVSGYQGSGELLAQSGRERIGSPFAYGQAQVVNAGMDFPDVATGGRVLLRVAARSTKPSVFHVKSGGLEIGALKLDGIPGIESNILKARVAEGVFTIPEGKGPASVSIEYDRPSASAQAWIVKASFNIPHKLEWKGSAFYPYLTPLGGVGEAVGVVVGRCDKTVRIWDISDFFKPKSFSSCESVRVNGGRKAQLAVFGNGDVKEPEYHGVVANQNLHAMQVPELLIVSHGNFIHQAEQIADIYRRSPLTHLSVEVVDVEKIYNEFSAGLKDATAIRNFARMLYWRGGGANGAFKYLLLFGKPSCDLYDTNELINYVPNYQTLDSYDVVRSFGTDDYFALLDEGEGEDEGGLDIGVGRYAVQKEEEAEAVLIHERSYHDPRNWGQWLSRAIFLADDAEGLIFMEGSDSLARGVERRNPVTNVRKLYADAFKQETKFYRMLYPTLRDAFNAEMRRGAFLINYIGHGSEYSMMHEMVSSRDNSLQWNNLTKLPVMVAASCRMAVYDLPDVSSFTADAVMRPQGGIMALIAASQSSFSGSNFEFNEGLMRAIYPSEGANKSKALGEAVSRAKNGTTGRYNKRKYILLGNPALPLLNASAKISVEAVGTVEGKRVAKDTVKGGGVGFLTASVSDIGGVPFEGTVFLEVQGKKIKIRTYDNDAETPFEYEDRLVTLFRGKATARAGKVHFTWQTPQDGDFQYGVGRVALFAASKEGLGAGSYDRVVVGGASRSVIEDDGKGPTVTIYLNDDVNRKRYVVGRNPLLIVKLSDASGINSSGAAQGHDLLLELTHEGGETERIVLNDFYVADEDTYQQGQIRYQLSNLQEGKYRARVIAWDAVNNKGGGECDFEVTLSKDARVENLLNYPNPFTSSTSFYLDVTSSEQPIEVLIQIFSVDGQLVRTLRHVDVSRQGRVGPIFWEGTDSYGRRVARGVYFYRAKVFFREVNGVEARSVERYEKLVIL